MSNLWIFYSGEFGTIPYILRTRTGTAQQPPEWGVALNPHSSPTFFQLLNTARRYQAILESSWIVGESMRKAADENSYTGPSRRRSYNRRRNVNLTETYEEDTGLSTESEEEKEVHYSSRKSLNPKRAKSNKKADFPHGKAINGYQFSRDDTVVNSHPPNGVCYICTSPKHVFRDCPHYGRFSILREAQLVDWVVDPEVEKAANQQYLDSVRRSNSHPWSCGRPFPLGL